MRSQHQPNRIIIYTKHTINIHDRNTTQCNEIVKICKFLEHTHTKHNPPPISIYI